MLNTANIYIDLLNKIKESGGAVPPELVAEVEALDETINGDETTEPPTVGLVDIVADLGDSVEDLDIDINGDDTTEPPTPGLKDRVSELETTVNGDTTTTPETPGLVDRVESIESIINNQTKRGSTVSLTSYTTDPYITETDGYVRIAGSTGNIVFDGAVLLSAVGSGINVSCYVKKGSELMVGGSPDSAVFIPLITNV